MLWRRLLLPKHFLRRSSVIQRFFSSTNDKNNSSFYCLSMFPYPSGNLHMGHVRVYTISDTLARYNRLLRSGNNNVLHPMGWDAFGLPAENAAIERNISPEKWTRQNILSMKSQLSDLGLSFDWSSTELATCDESYYKWTQVLFTKLHEAGLAYQADALVNWDPVDKTVLANEQVDASNRSWRSGAIVEQRSLRQWFFKITDYSERLLKDLDTLNWPKSVVKMQKAWIGKSTGWTVDFEIINNDDDEEHLQVFTTRLETLYGVTFVAIASDHKLAKKGVTKCRHPLTKEELPIYVAPYVLSEYGTGAVMGVPGHDARDREFVESLEEDGIVAPKIITVLLQGDDYLVESGECTGLSVHDARTKIQELLQEACSVKESYKLRDWLVSRQRYWGAPIPVIHCPDCGPVCVPESDLPVTLAQQADDNATVTCPKCANQNCKRETDTLDTFVDSSWYFLRYPDARNDSEMFNKEVVASRIGKDGIDLYIGGIEHAILHLLYSRFITKFLYDQRMISFQEPFKELLTQGMVLGKTLKDSNTGAYIKPSDGPIDEANTTVVYEKMSKSKHNGVDPNAMIKQYGPDATRLAMLFKAPPSVELEWDERDILGQVRWINRLWKLVNSNINATASHNNNSSNNDAVIQRALNHTISRVSHVMKDTRAFNVAIAELMKLSNVLSDNHSSTVVYRHALESLIIMLHPMAPHNTSEMLKVLSKNNISWPSVVQNVVQNDLRSKKIKLVVQVRGKVRGNISLEDESILKNHSKITSIAKESLPNVSSLLIDDVVVKKVVVIKSKKNDNDDQVVYIANIVI